MQVHELPRISQQFEIGLRHQADPSFGLHLMVGHEVRIQKLHSTDEIVLVDGNHNWPVLGSNNQHKRVLDNLLFENWPRLCWISAALPKQQETAEVYIKGCSFIRQHLLPEGDNQFVIGISDRIFDELRKAVLRKSSLSQQQILAWLAEEFVVDTHDGPCFAISAGMTSEIDRTVSSFRLYGRKTAMDIDQTSNLLRVDKIIRSPRPNSEHAFVLMRGHLVFQDISIAMQMNTSGRTELDAIIQQSAGSYLGIWREYNQIERNILQDRARRIGWLDYKRYWPIPDGWRLEVSRQSSNEQRLEEFGSLEEIDLEISAELPEEVREDDDKSSEAEEDDNPLNLQLLSKEISGLPVRCIGFDVERMTIDVRPTDIEDVNLPPEKGFIYVSVSGDRYRLRRREFAWQRVRYMQTPIPGLGFLLERSDKFAARDYKAQRLDSKDLREVFDIEPTDRQRMAIRMAINTPDIAMIQGPPGTGKTRVITALNKILMDDQSAIKKSFGDTLLTSFQHDAVENVASLSSVFGLPAIKVGHRHTRDQAYDPSTAWRKKLVDELLNDPQRQVATPVREVHNRVKTLLRGYIKSPTESRITSQMLRDVFASSYDYISQEVRDALINLSHQLEQGIAHRNWETDADEQKIIRAARSLRVEPIGFADDGPRNARILLSRVEKLDWISTDEKELLNVAADWAMDAEQPSFLPQLAEIQSKIIEHYLNAKPLDRAGLINADVERLLTQVVEELYQFSVSHPDNAAELIVQRFIFDLENDPGGAFRTLQNYSFVLAATCQQSVGQAMQRIKVSDSKERMLDFESVIVDEASRSNPLDLLIPLSLARRRIVLVGDHRQLPHMLEPDVEKRLNQSSRETQDYLRLSLFERLFRHLQDLQKQDGIQRTVTLDRQYRMHPVLGQFVSDTFYKPYGEGYRSDHLDPINFAHEVESYAGKVAVWMHLPYGKGAERGNQSKFRVAEARWIAREAKKIIDAHPNYSVGVITFYSAQVRQILQEMARAEIDLAEQMDGDFQINKTFQYAADGRERLRLGTVDAFQGKEFDIVLLSLVRSNDQVEVVEDEATWRRKYGFLTLENRLCVAMSRQKRLLIVVGDADMLSGLAAGKAVPGLVAFHKLCGEGYGLRLSA